MKSDKLVDLMFSPPFIAKLLHHFLSGAKKINSKGIKTEVLYLSIPFIIDDILRDRLLSTNSRSTYATVFKQNTTLEVKNSLSRKNSQSEQYRRFVNFGLIYLGNIEHIEVNNYINCQTTIDYKKEEGLLLEYCKSAYYLGIILAKEDYRNIFVKLGVTNI